MSSATRPCGGLGDVALDGGTASTVAVSSTGTAANALLWSTTGVSKGPHTLTVRGDTSPHGSGGNGHINLNKGEACP